jgi:uncharacterized protein YjbI with pentapeptide repeats
MATFRNAEIRNAYFHKAEFYKGIFFECVSDRLWIEGGPVDIDIDAGRNFTARLATRKTFTAKTLPDVAKLIIDGAAEFKERREAAREHRKKLDECEKAQDQGRSWNEWRQAHPQIHPMLANQELSGRDFSDFDFSYANLCMAKLRRTKLMRASFHQAILAKAECYCADFSGANFCRTDLYETDLRKATLIGANLRGVQLALTDCSGARFKNCTVYGISAWRLKLEGTIQEDLVITSHGEAKIAVDNLEVAQFAYMLLHNEKIRDVIDTIGKKAVLILGRFTEDRKAVLDAMRENLRERGYLPILFDFEGPLSRNTDETITLLARMARFIIADISDAKSVLQELRTIVPNLPSVPVQPVIATTQEEPGMFNFYHHFPWFLEVHRYSDKGQLIADLSERVILPAETKVQELRHAHRE